jgi:hypothetical protein
MHSKYIFFNFGNDPMPFFGNSGSRRLRKKRHFTADMPDDPFRSDLEMPGFDHQGYYD